MRTFFILLVLINLGVFALGQTNPAQARSEAGRSPASKTQAPLNPDSVKLGRPQSAAFASNGTCCNRAGSGLVLRDVAKNLYFSVKTVRAAALGLHVAARAPRGR